MSRTSTRQWLHIARTIRTQAREHNTPCHLCKGTLGPIDYRTKGEADREARRAGRYWEIGQHRPLSFACDHITPHAAGGKDTIDNAAASHRICNERAGAKQTPRPRKPQPVNGHWWPINGDDEPLKGRAIPGTRTSTHEFRA